MFSLIDKEADERPTGKEVYEGLSCFLDYRPGPTRGAGSGILQFVSKRQCQHFPVRVEVGNVVRSCHLGRLIPEVCFCLDPAKVVVGRCADFVQ